jgi:hypothetical protein
MASFPLLIEAALRALLVALVVWAGLRLLRVGNVLAQKTVWALVLAAAVAMPLLMRWQGLPGFAILRVPLPLVHPVAQTAPTTRPTYLLSPHIGAVSTSTLPYADGPSAIAAGGRFPAPSMSIKDYRGSSPASLMPAQTDPVTIQQVSSNEAIAPEPVVRRIHWQSLAGFLYLAIAAAFIVRVIIGLAAALKLWLGAEPVLLDVDFAHSRTLHVRSSAAITSPVTIGSAVLLPADYTEWDAEKLRIVLAHERSHIRQGDFYLQLLAAVYAAIFWFSPLGWWLKSKLRNLGEAIGDHAALNHAASPASYAQLLLEFAALPRPTLIGVDMARPSTISQRIERLLNDSTFRQAFAAGKSRALAAVLIVPVAIFAATALVRVEAAAAGQSQAPSPASSPVPASAPSPAGTASAPNPAESPDPAATPQSSDAASTPDAAQAPRAPQLPAVPGSADQSNVPNPPELLVRPDAANQPDLLIMPDQKNMIILRDQAQVQAKVNALVKAQVNAQVNAQVKAQVLAAGTYKMLQDGKFYQLNGPNEERSYSYVMSDNGDSYAIVSGPDTKFVFSGNWHGATPEDIEKARKMAHGKFLWFSHEGKSYIVEDPTVIAQIEEMYKPIEVLGREQGELGKKEAELGKLQGELGKQAEFEKIKVPDISKEMAEVNAAMSKLQAEMGKEVNREELAQVEGKLAMLQAKLGAMQGGFSFKDGDWGGKMSQWGAEQGKLGAEQGRLGAEQGRLAREADRKVKAIIEESLKDGKAKPVE